MIYRSFLAPLLCLAMALALTAADMPLPWKRELVYQQEETMTGNDVFILQNLINRDQAVRGRLSITSAYDADTYTAVRAFQLAHKISVTGIFDEATANELLDCCSRDGVRDTGFTAASLG